MANLNSNRGLWSYVMNPIQYLTVCTFNLLILPKLPAVPQIKMNETQDDSLSGQEPSTSLVYTRTVEERRLGDLIKSLVCISYDAQPDTTSL